MKKSASIRLTHAQRKVVADLVPDLADRLLLETTNQRTLQFDVREIEAILSSAKAAISHADNGVTRNSLRHIIDAATKSIHNAQGVNSIPVTERLYQFKITLTDSKPPIWRRIQVKNCTLDKFHEHIQTAMGWTNSHLHEFEINGDRYGDPELLDDGFEDFECVDSTVTKISDILPQDGKPSRFNYEYDFGDGWQHEVLFEGCLRADKGIRYPLCLEGEQSCPPEDVGGIGGFCEFLKAIADPEHEDHDRFLEWAGPFDPEEFSAEKATKAMRRGLPDWRSMNDDF